MAGKPLTEPEKWADGVLSGVAAFTLTLSSSFALTSGYIGWMLFDFVPFLGVFLGVSLFGALGLVCFHDLTKAPFGWIVSNFQKQMKIKYKQNWEGSLSFEKIIRYLLHFKSAIQVPIYVLGINL